MSDAFPHNKQPIFQSTPTPQDAQVPSSSDDEIEVADQSLLKFITQRIQESSVLSRAAFQTQKAFSPVDNLAELSASSTYMPSVPLPNSANASPQQPILSGNRLNRLDSQLVKDHLERYLPTPSTRYQMMRERVQQEIQELFEQINHYSQLPGHEYDQKQQAMQERMYMLEQQLVELNGKVAELNPFLNAYQQMTKLTHRDTAVKTPAKNRFMWFRNPDKACRDVADANEQLDVLNHMLELQLNDPSFSPSQMGRLINEYENQLRAVEALAEKLRGRRGLRDKLNEKITEWIRQLYTGR